MLYDSMIFFIVQRLSLHVVVVDVVDVFFALGLSTKPWISWIEQNVFDFDVVLINVVL